MSEESAKSGNISKSEEKIISVAKWLSLGGLLLIVLGVGLFLFKESLFSFNKEIDAQKFGQFGDFIGGVVGSLWAFTGVLLFYFALQLQRKEIQLQREDLQLTREEIKGQKEELRQQNETLQLQQFENRFFQLIQLHQSIVESIFVNTTVPQFKITKSRGKEFFEELSAKIAFNFRYDGNNDIFGKDRDEKIHKIYQTAFHLFKAHLGHYFRNLYHLVRYIDENKFLTKPQKIEYTKILRGQLSNYELVMLAYNGLSPQGESFYSLILKYELVKGVDFEVQTDQPMDLKIIDRSFLVERYPFLKSEYEEQKKRKTRIRVW